MKRTLIYVALVLPAVALLYFSLTRNPRDLPSALLGRAAPDFELVGLEGEKVSLSRLKGQPVVLNFWSTWCGPCLGEHRLIQQAIRRSEKVRFLAILYEDTPENASRFLKEYGKGAPVLLDPDLRTAINYGVSGVPETFFIDANGIVVDKQAGMLTAEILFQKIGLIQ